MRGDFSRGHKPDRQRGRDYRRVLLQQGRPLLDSDFNAQTDANEHLIRDLARALGGDNGSPDGGFLITAGPLLACFGSMDDVQVQGETGFEPHLDYQLRFGERLPSLYLDARRGKGSVTLRFRQQLAPPPQGSTAPRYTRLRIWARARALPWVRVGDGTQQPLPGSPHVDGFLPYDIELPSGSAASALTLGFDEAGPEKEAWIGLVEGAQAQPSPGLRFWITRGRYLVDGSPVRLAQDGWFPEVSFPQALGFTHPEPEQGTYVAFLEAWERHVTPVEDPGLMELALGGTVDTCTRVEAMGQVKVARLEAPSREALNRADLQRAFAAASTSSARLQVTDSGFGGAENWLYRFEVHAVAEAQAEVVLKWSRNNGAELHPLLEEDAVAQSVTLPLSADIQEGDLVEVLSEGTERGDSRDGRVTGGGGVPLCFIPPVRSVGALFQVRGVQTTAAGKELQLHPWDTALSGASAAQGSSTGRVGAQLKKIRRWDGLFRTKVPSPFPVQLEDGLQVTLSGSGFRVGDYWQFAARRRMAGGTAPAGEPPHGPERLFVPLAGLSYSGGNPPVTTVERWLDEQFAPLGRLQAHALAYDRSTRHSSASSVQEALDELYGLYQQALDWLLAGTRDWELVFASKDENDDAGPRINVAIRKLGPGGVVCLMGGTFWIKTPITIGEGKSIELRGFPKAMLLVKDLESPPNDAVISVGTRGQLTLREVTLAARDGRVRSLIHLANECRSFRAEACGLYLPSREDGIAIRLEGGSETLPDREESPDMDFEVISPPDENASGITLRDCIVVAGWALCADRLMSLEMHDSILLCARVGVSAATVGSIDGRGLHIDTSLNANILQRWMDLPETLEHKARDHARQYNSHWSDHGTAIYVHSLLSGSLVDSTLLANMALWLQYGRALRLERNRIFAGDTGVRMHGAIEVLMRELTLEGDGFGIHLPVYASRVDILDCEVSSYEKIAILLLRPYAEGSTPTESPFRQEDLAHVLVGRGRFMGRRGGIQIGSEALVATASYPVRCSHVHLFENDVRAGNTLADSVGVSVYGITARASSDVWIAEAWEPLRITDNRVRVDVWNGNAIGVRVVRGWTGVELCRNEVHVTVSRDEESPLSSGTVVSFERSNRLLVAENHLLWMGHNAGGSGVGIQMSDQCMDVWVMRNSIEVRRSSDSVGNEETLTETIHMDLVRELQMAENELWGGVILSHVRTSTVRDNVFNYGDLIVRSSSSNSVQRNRVRMIESSDTEGRWVVGENDTQSIKITPRYRLTGGENFESVYEVSVHGNRCIGNLQVGLVSKNSPALDLGEFGIPDDKSIVLVTDNRVEKWLAVNDYSKLIVEHNVLGRRAYTLSDAVNVFTQRNIIITPD